MGLFGKKDKQQVVTNVELDAKLFLRIANLLSSHGGEMLSEKGIAFSPNKQELEIVGESFCQEDIKARFEPENWEYGFLAPEQTNKFDPNAVALYLIYSEPIEKNKLDYGAVKVGYLKKELAKKVSQQIVQLLLTKGEVVPVLAIIKAGNKDTDNWGIRAYAKTDSIKF